MRYKFGALIETADILFLGLVVLLARLGLCLYLCGASRSKNAAGAILRATADFCVAILAFWAFGQAILSWDIRALFWVTFVPDARLVGFAAVTILLATGAALGGTLERTRFGPTLIVSAVMAGLVVPLAGRIEVYGLSHWQLIDCGGAGWLYMTGGLCAAIGAIVVGPRGGKYNQDGSTNLIPGHSFPMMAAGTFFIMLGILAELAGGADSLSQGEAICNGLLAAAAAGLVAMIYGHYRYGITDVHLAVIGLLGGIVSVSAGAQDMPACAAAIIGAVAGFLVPWAVVQIDLKHKIDDPASSIGTYAVAGAWGMLAAGIFAPGTLMARLHQILIQLAALVAVATLSLIVLGMTWLIMRAVMPLRLGEADELDGGDLAELDVNAYPDFQQTTIKSYHLRET